MGDRLYVIGGNNDQDGIQSSAERFDPERHLWLKFQELTNATVGAPIRRRGQGHLEHSPEAFEIWEARPPRQGRWARARRPRTYSVRRRPFAVAG